MQARAKNLGAKFDLRTAAGRGTSIVIRSRPVLELFQYIFGLVRLGRSLADYTLRAGLLTRRTLATADFACNNLFSSYFWFPLSLTHR